MIQDLRGQTMGGASKRSQTNKIGLHHSGTESGNAFIFEKFWRSKGWVTGGYGEIILRDGNVQICYDADVLTNGVRGHNNDTYHMNYVGVGNPTDEQKQAINERIAYNMERFNLTIDDVLGHYEFKGAATSCPGIDMVNFRNNFKMPEKKRSEDKLQFTSPAAKEQFENRIKGMVENGHANKIWLERIEQGTIKNGDAIALTMMYIDAKK